jgi:hypothetical protein
MPELDGIYLISPHCRDRAAILTELIGRIRATPEGLRTTDS